MRGGRRRLAMVLAFVAVPAGAQAATLATEPPAHAAKLVFGSEPDVGFYELSGAGSRFLVWRDFASRYRVSVFRLRIRRGSSSACRPYKNQFAVVGGDHALRPLVAHRAEANELSYGSTRVYEYAAGEQDRADVSIDGHHFPGELNVDIGEGPVPEKPVVGWLSIGIEGLDCTVGFVGRLRRH
ncbi:MAG: hypothetical protein JSS97_03045 [Actinobacteria bacterium]|nr:hypothetical protein [Actinomycetota bacterium]